MKFGSAARTRRPSLGAELAALERNDPAVAAAAADLDRVTSEITGRPLPARLSFRDRNRADVAHAAAEKAKRVAEAERWIAEVRARRPRKP